MKCPRHMIQMTAMSKICINFGFSLFDIDPFQNKPWFLRVCSISQMRNCSLQANSPFCQRVFSSFGELSYIFIKFEIVVCQLFQIGRV